MTLQYSEYQDNMNIRISDITNKSDRSAKNKTYKRREPLTNNVKEGFDITKDEDVKPEEFLNSLNEDEELADFRPNEEKIDAESFSNSKNSACTDEFYKQHIPYYTQLAKSPLISSNDELMEKLNYMINLIENQQEERTENETEELVLYLFLGVFVIFVVDSFARAGKYYR